MSDSFRDHLLEGHSGPCLVCNDEDMIYLGWTDYNGQTRCGTCGCTYQILGCHIKEETLKEMGITKEQVAERYCDCFDMVEVLRAFWEECCTRVPLGTYLGKSPDRPEDKEQFYLWLASNRERFQHVDSFNWDAITEWAKEHQGTHQEAGA